MTENERSYDYLDKVSIQTARVVMSAAYYDDDLTIAISAALGLNALQCNALVRPLSSRGKLDLCNRLMADADEDSAKIVQKHTRRVGKLLDKRNALVHGTFGHDSQNRVGVTTYMGKNKLSGKRERWSAADISELADCILLMRDQVQGVSVLLANALQAAETRGQ